MTFSELSADFLIQIGLIVIPPLVLIIIMSARPIGARYISIIGSVPFCGNLFVFLIRYSLWFPYLSGEKHDIVGTYFYTVANMVQLLVVGFVTSIAMLMAAILKSKRQRQP